MTDYTPKDYIIRFPLASRDEVAAALATYTLRVSELLPAAYVRVHSLRQEESLLETLAQLPGVSYRTGIEHTIMGKTEDRDVRD